MRNVEFQGKVVEASDLTRQFRIPHSAFRIGCGAVIDFSGKRAFVTGGGRGSGRGEALHADYSATKGAVIALTQSLAVELAPRQINVNCVAPGWVDTEMSAQPYGRDTGDGRREIEDTIPLGRVASAEDVAGPIAFICSDLARHITCEVLNVNGGRVLCT